MAPNLSYRAPTPWGYTTQIDRFAKKAQEFGAFVSEMTGIRDPYPTQEDAEHFNKQAREFARLLEEMTQAFHDEAENFGLVEDHAGSWISAPGLEIHEMTVGGR